MKEIYAGNLSAFFENTGYHAICVFRVFSKDNLYTREIWEIPDDVFDCMCNMPEDVFLALAGEEGWWRYCPGSVLPPPVHRFKINGINVKAWLHGGLADTSGVQREYPDLLSYLSEQLGVSTEKNVCALAADMARFNGYTMGELFALTQPHY